MKKKLLKIATILCCTSLFYLTLTFAAENKTVALNPKEVVTDFFKAIISNDYDKAVDILREEGLSKKEQKEDLKEIMSYDDTAVVSVDNVVISQEYDNYVELKVTASYKDGSQVEEPILLKKENNGTYKLKRISIDSDSNEIDQKELNSIFGYKDDSELSNKNAKYAQTELVN